MWPLKDMSCNWGFSNLVDEINTSSSEEDDDDWISFM